MESTEFRNLFDHYRDYTRSADDLRNVREQWKRYYDAINAEAGLPFEAPDGVSWIKSTDNDTQYLPGFIDRMRAFGRARTGNFEQVMIYRNTGNGPRNGQYFDGYRATEGNGDGYFPGSAYAQIEIDYNEKIKPLLKNILQARKFTDLTAIEKSNLYTEFSAKQFLRKLSLLNSLFGEVEYKNQLLWIYNGTVVDNLVKIINPDNLSDSPTFFEKSRAILQKVAGWMQIEDVGEMQLDNQEDAEKLCKLNELLWKLGSLNVSELTDLTAPNVVYHGAPGTGKTYTTLQTVRMLCQGNERRYKYCQFHPSYSYQDFIEGIKPMGITNGNVELRPVNGIFKQFCIDVKKENEETYKNAKDKNNIEYPHYYFIADEINRGDLSRILGEAFTLLEPDYRDKDFSGEYTANETLTITPLSAVIENTPGRDPLAYKLIGGKVYFGIPFNIHFIGLMNDVDKSIDTFDLALRRRFKWILTECRYDVIQNQIVQPDIAEKYIASCKELNKYICDPNGLGLSKVYQFGHSYFMKVGNPRNDEELLKSKKSVFEHYIETTLREYVRGICDEYEIDSKIDGAREVFGLRRNNPGDEDDG